MELLSPAGTLEKLRVAVDYGADAVYLGVKKLSLRERAGNFTIEELEEGINYARKKGVKVYVTLNAFLKNKDLEEFKTAIKEITPLKPDAFIVSDIGGLSIAAENSNIPIHISTQANVTNYEAVKVYKSLGASRIVLARELSIEEIREIKEKLPEMEIEVFVHGALCMAYSGRCLLSNYLSHRDSNKGACSQSCRWKYYVMEEKREGELYQIEEDSHGTYIFNSKDLCALPLLDKLYDAGVDSVKIEGRVKSSYYVAVTTAIYRQAINLIKEGKREKFKEKIGEFVKELEKVSHRPYTTGFLTEEKELQHFETSSYIRNYRFLGIYKDGIWQIRNKIKTGAKVELFFKEGFSKKTEIVTISKDESKIEEAHPNFKVQIEFKNKITIPELTILRERVT
ncbi:peptidase U32 family protein [Desulfurobacterium atlanticum]|uniref:Putative protease n=1 Tax=Desulfurobacterium atlanticum TaxID=240169 RepID=A0A238XRU1_9BACT|nr:peptidase U32 family protein [Desulfurobacterium atlanticum]SNR61657.1 putative protease [Desulfurobacterium atlanticum]